MRSWILPAILALAVLALVIALPVIWQWDYHIRLLRAVPVGSTHEQYTTAMLTGHLGPGDPRPGCTYTRPLNFHGIVYTIFAYPRWDSTGHLTGYSMCAELSVRGHFWWFGHPNLPEVTIF